jgi:hypothetical protein
MGQDDLVAASAQMDTSQDAQTWPSAMAAMAEARDRVVAAGAWTAGPSTLMGVLDLSRAEVQNCKVLRWLLDPLARHGFGAELTAALGAHLGVGLREPALARVGVEVGRARSRADVVIEELGADMTVVIEAKIDAAEGARQAHRLELDWPEAERLVFLTVLGARIASTAVDPARWQPLAWTWFATQVHDLLETVPVTADPRALDARRAAADWLTGVRRYLQ